MQHVSSQKRFTHAILGLMVLALFQLLVNPLSALEPSPIRKTVKSGNWSSPDTWENQQVPGTNDVVLIRPGHHVTYDENSTTVIHAVHIAGQLSFSEQKDTLLCAGLIEISSDESCKEEGFDCHTGMAETKTAGEKPALEVGTLDSPMPPERKAIIRLTYIPGMDKDSFPALVCCGGRMDLHGAPLERTWQKLGYQTPILDHRVIYEPRIPAGWRAGDQVLFTGTGPAGPDNEEFVGIPFHDFHLMKDITHSEVRTMVKFGDWSDTPDYKDIQEVGLDEPLHFQHEVLDNYQGEMVDLTRNVVVESADPKGERGHTMYHWGSTGGLSYVEFRHLGKKGVLGRYPVHFHLTGDTMRGSAVVGCSIWDSDNRAISLHGCQYMVVKDNVAYNITGHAFFLEDGTETQNILDRNLACLVKKAEPLPGQTFAFDMNQGSGFWWANNLNSFTRNVAVECDEAGFRMEASRIKDKLPMALVRQADGTSKMTDLRTVPFIRFDGNEAHRQRGFCFNIGGYAMSDDALDKKRQDLGMAEDSEGYGPDYKHPLIITNCRGWDAMWLYNCRLRCSIVDELSGFRCIYGIFRNIVNLEEIRHTHFEQIENTAYHNGWDARAKPQDEEPMDVAPVDDEPPSTVILSETKLPSGWLRITGVTEENYKVKSVKVNGVEAQSTRDDFAEWSADVPNPADGKVTAISEDATGNVEKVPHQIDLRLTTAESTASSN